MIPALLIWIYKKYGTRVRRYISGHPKSTLNKLAVLALIFCAHPLLAQEFKTSYRVKHNGNVIGRMELQQQITGADIHLKISSEVSTRFIMGIEVKTRDQSCFRNNQLTYSTVYRSVNGKEKENKQTRLVGDRYQLQDGKQTSTPISYNMMLLYCREPVSITQVYSDNFQQFLPIQKMSDHTYRVKLPDGNYNDYHFRNGTCNLVVIHHSWYTIRMEEA